MAEDEEEEDFAYFGSALEPLEEGQTTVKKPVPLQEQTVKDERGRYQRFHGAFTGGFSAGYFNSVGSKEGWAPSTFVSSRQQKAETQMFAPEHFMDEEDLEEHGIAPRGIVTRSSFASKATDAVQERARALASVAGPIPGASALEDLITLATVTVGVRLLRLMGWKEGQGLGPRVKRKAQRQYIEPAVRVYGCSLPDEELQQPQECEGEADLPEGLTFAPRDVVPMDFTPKDDRHGLGYSGIDPRRALCGSASLDPHTLVHTHPNPAHRLLEQAQATGRTRPGITGQAFGVGALEDEDDDIYSRDSLSRYDSVLNEEEPGDGLYGWTAPTPTPRGRGRGVCLQQGYVGKELEGFTLGAATTKSITVYPAPELPRDYRPVHHFGPAVTMGTASVALAQALGQSAGQISSPAETHGRHQLNATQRRELLGESALAGPRSVFDLLTVEDKERLQEAQRAAGRLTSPPPCQLQTLPLALPSSSGLGQEPSGFKPFLKDPPKQQRYEQFVQSLRAGQSEALAGCLDPSMTEWEQGREREEFGLAAVLYRPHSASLASRFTHAKLSDHTDHVEVPQQQESDVQDKDAAVTMNMFGTLTRDKFEWHPEKLLCKRFNVPDPYPGSTNVGLLKVKRDKYSVFNFLTVPTVAAARGTVQPSGAQRAAKSSRVEGKRRSRWDVPAENMEEDGAGPAIPASAPGDSTTPHGGEEPPACLPHDKADAEGEDSRPPMDLFKAVFASSSEERSSSSSSEDEDANQTEAPPKAEEAAQPSHETAPTRTLPGLVQQLGGGGGAGGTQPRPRSPQTPVGGEEFGPRLPPALVHGFPGAGSITVETPSKERERHSGGAANREERRREKDSSSSQREEREQKKHKDRRKGKKQKKESKKKHKKHRVRRSATGGSVGREEPLALQQRMKNVPLMFH